MTELNVGKPYPEKLTIKDGLAVQPHPSGLMALVHLSDFRAGDKKAFGGPVAVAVRQVEDDVPWLALRFHKNGLVLDGPVLVGHRPELLNYLREAGNGLQLVVTEGGHHIVRCLRLLGLSDEVLRAIKTAGGQAQRDRADLQRIVRRVQRRFPGSDDIYDAAALTQDFQ